MMVRAVIAVLLGCLLSLSVTAANVTLSAATPSLGAKGDLLKFTQITDTAPWPGRRMAFVKQLPTSLSFKPEGSTKTTTLVNPLILVGGFDPAWNQAEQNDVWASRDAKTCQSHTNNNCACIVPLTSVPLTLSLLPSLFVLWRAGYLVSGTTFDGDSAATVSYDVFQGPCCGYSGNTAMLTTESGYTLIHVAEDVWSTTNTVTWKPVAQSGSYPYTQRNLASPLVVTSTNHIIRIAGQGGDNNAFQNDVLMSADSGKSWKVMTDMAPFTERFTATTFSLQNPSNLEGKDIVYVIGGRSTRDNYNDVSLHTRTQHTAS